MCAEATLASTDRHGYGRSIPAFACAIVLCKRCSIRRQGHEETMASRLNSQPWHASCMALQGWSAARVFVLLSLAHLKGVAWRNGSWSVPFLRGWVITHCVGFSQSAIPNGEKPLRLGTIRSNYPDQLPFGVIRIDPHHPDTRAEKHLGDGGLECLWGRGLPRCVCREQRVQASAATWAHLDVLAWA